MCDVYMLSLGLRCLNHVTRLLNSADRYVLRGLGLESKHLADL